MGISGLLNISEKKKAPVYFVGNDKDSSPQPSFTAIGASTYPSSTRTVARVVAYFELITALVFWVPVLNIPRNLYLFYAWNNGEVYGQAFPEWDVVMFVIACTISRFLAAALLLIGTFKNESWYTVPYLLVQMLLLFGGPFVLMYSSLGYNGTLPVLRYNIGWVAMLPLIFILVRVEYIKWRSVYHFYDALTAKHISSEFAKIIDNETLNTQKMKEASKADSEWYLQRVYGTATMQEIDAKEAEALVPQVTNEDTIKA
ncbi:hypothetical protein GE061_012386 [Apolygus lucorum]|uniref:Uncharacterized protein n=1 Tax=Apolygus lucorum TaxID=248454 RepID=A0A6A4JIE5_APOLU|nr:hypothetical protein GE061_012386 [Apolygus lucorum]